MPHDCYLVAYVQAKLSFTALLRKMNKMETKFFTQNIFIEQLWIQLTKKKKKTRET